MEAVLDIIPDEIDESEYQAEVSRLTRQSNWARKLAETEEALEAMLDAIRDYDGNYEV